MSLGKLDSILDNSGASGGKKHTLLNFIARIAAEKDKALLPAVKNAILNARKAALLSVSALETDITDCVADVAVLAVNCAFKFLFYTSFSCWIVCRGRSRRHWQQASPTLRSEHSRRRWHPRAIS
jgi:hypothetical protein